VAPIDVAFEQVRAFAPGRVLDAGCGPGGFAERLVASLAQG
jgi:2-polyprenyl-3-methyl-5-hydroxy-6-metoxy-1,4-benzoquinol methylase